MRISDWSSDVCSSDLLALQLSADDPLHLSVGVRPERDLQGALLRLLQLFAMVPIQLVAVDVTAKVAIVVVGELLVRKAPQEVAQKQGLVGELVPLDRHDAFEPCGVVFAPKCGEAFAETTRSGEHIHHGIGFMRREHSQPSTWPVEMAIQPEPFARPTSMPFISSPPSLGRFGLSRLK